MALTENSFTAEEFNAAIAANPDLMPIIKGTLSANKLVVQDEAEHTAFKTNFENEVSTRLTKTHAEKLEADVLAATGIPKKSPDEKYYDYFKRAAAERFGKVTEMENELAELKKGKLPNEIDKARIAELEKALADKETDYTGKLTAKETEILNMKKGSQFDIAVQKVRAKYKQGLPEDMVKLSEQAIVAQLMAVAEVQSDGVITFPKEDGTPELDPKTYKPVTVEQKIEKALESLIEIKKVKTGTGAEGEEPAAKNKEGKIDFTGLPNGITTKVELSAHLYKLGLTSDDPQFDEILAEFGKDLKLR